MECVGRCAEELGVPEAERNFCAGLQAQYDSEVVYGSLLQELDRQGIIFTDTDPALQEYPELVRKYFGTVVTKACSGPLPKVETGRLPE